MPRSHAPPAPPSVAAAPSASAPASASAEAAAAEPPPPYDLAADLQARKETVRSEAGRGTAFQVVDDVFLVSAPSGSLGSSGFVAKQAIKAYFTGRFSTRPSAAVTVLLFDSATPYEAWCRAHGDSACSTPFGFYERASRTVVMNAGPGIGTLTHELVHPIVETDFPGAPAWIDEGVASLYEAFAFGKPGEIRGKKNFRWPGLRDALASDREHASLPALFALNDSEFRGEREGLNYALARYFCMWMDGQEKLWPFYRAWRDDRANDPTGEKALLQVMGKTPAELDAGWAGWVRAL